MGSHMRFAFIVFGLAVAPPVLANALPIADTPTGWRGWGLSDCAATCRFEQRGPEGAGPSGRVDCSVGPQTGKVHFSLIAAANHVAWGPESQVRLRVRGSLDARPTSSVLIFVERGGGEKEGNSHWVLDIPLAVYVTPDWTEVALPPLSQAEQPSWTRDANGEIDYGRIDEIMIAYHSEPPSVAPNRPLTLWFRDLQALEVERREDLTNVTEAVLTIPADQPAGRPPRGIVGRKREPPPVTDFSRLSGWRTRATEGMQARLMLTREQRLFADTCAKIEYTAANGAVGTVRVEPPAPLPIPGRFNAATLWCFGNHHGWMPHPGISEVELIVHVKDAAGTRFEFSLGRVRWKFWFLLHHRIADDVLAAMRLPAAFEGLEIRGCDNTEPNWLYFADLTFYEEKPTRLRSPVALDDLPFPTRKDTILPSQAAGYRNRVRRDGDDYVFEYLGDDCALRYRYTPTDGSLSDLSVEYGDRRFQPAEGGGLLWQVGLQTYRPGDPRVKATLLESRLRGGRLHTRWHWRTRGRDRVETTFDLDLRIKQKSLIVSLSSPTGDFSGVTFGQARGVAEPKLVWVPYITTGVAALDRTPQVLYSDGLFLSGWVDWYVSQASRLDGRAEILSEDAAAFNGGTSYLPATDGRRNPVGERLFITVSPDFHEVLPTVANPPSPWGEVTGPLLYRSFYRGERDRYQNGLEDWRRYKRYGIDNIFIRHHEETWTDPRDGGQGMDEFTQTTEVAPDVTEREVIDYIATVRDEIGYRIGLYTNYTDFQPVGRTWDPRHVTIRADGQWQGAWPQCYNVKPIVGAAAEARLAPEIKRKFGPNASYCDVHTAVAPWGYLDYDALAPGAAKFQTTFRAYGKIMLNEKRVYGGPVFSEGRSHWCYAGLTDGNYGQLNVPVPSSMPVMPDFDLLKLHPLETDAGMGDVGMFFGGKPDWRKEWGAHGRSLYHWLATTIAYGHIGYQASGDMALTTKCYYLMQQLQSRYAMVPAKEIRYRYGDRLLTATEAIPVDAHLGRQVYVEYQNGLRVWVNCSEDSDWPVTVDGESYLLPPFGWLALGADDFTEYSCLRNGARADYVDSPVYRYLDGGDAIAESPGLSADGAVALRKLQPGRWQLILIENVKQLRIEPRSLLPSGAREVTLIPETQSGELREPIVAPADGLTLSPGEDIFCHWIEWDAQGANRDDAGGGTALSRDASHDRKRSDWNARKRTEQLSPSAKRRSGEK